MINRMRGYGTVAGLLVVGLGVSGPRRALAWGPDGHQTVATIADKLLAGTNAAAEVHKILGTTSLADAAVWADCAKQVSAPPSSPPPLFVYKEDHTHFPECAPFETAAGEADMIDFVKRNATNCDLKPDEETCHKQYHYADIPVQKTSYKRSDVGARVDDVTGAIQAAIAVLEGGTAPTPFNIKSKREALLLLVHYVGDIHQPLHVGAVYLDAKGKRVNPVAGHVDPATETRGGNQIMVVIDSKEKKLHGTWDDVPGDLKPHEVIAKWTQWQKDAKAVKLTQGQVAQWPLTWASDTQKQAQKAFTKVKFGPKTDKTWSATLPTGYMDSMTAIKRTQLTKAGARLAQLLGALWPGGPATAGGF